MTAKQANDTANRISAPDFDGTVKLCGKPFHVVNWDSLLGNEQFVCFHGGAQNAYSLPAMLEPFLRERGSVLSFQIPGLDKDVGADVLRRQPVWHPSLCDDVSRVLEFGGVQEGVFIGYSYGALLATMYAARFPERVKKLILVDLIPHRTEEQLERIIALANEPVAHRKNMFRLLKQLVDLLPFAAEDELLRGVVRDPGEVDEDPVNEGNLTLQGKKDREERKKCRFNITDFALNATLPSTISKVWPYARSLDTTMTEVLVLHAPFRYSQVGEAPLKLFFTDERTGERRPNMTAVEILGTEHGSVLSTGKVDSLAAIAKFLDRAPKSPAA